LSRRPRPIRELGEAISLENVLTLMTVLFVLRWLFFVPLVNLDRMTLVKAQKDEYWQVLSDYLMSKGDTATNSFYTSSFGLDGHRIVVTEAGVGDTRYIEALNNDGTLTVIEHRLGAGRFDALVVRGHSSVVGFRYGALKWSAAEQVWFTSTDSVDYGERKESVAMKDRYRAWTKQTRGF